MIRYVEIAKIIKNNARLIVIIFACKLVLYMVKYQNALDIYLRSIEMRRFFDMMSPVYIILSVVLALSCLCMIVAILMQKKRQAGFSGNVGGMGGDKTYFDKNKGRTWEGKLEKYTKFLGGFFMILSLVIGFIA